MVTDKDNEQLALDPEVLYDEGMAYYRRRQWRKAQECFERLHALQPNRRGVEALLRELDIFLQLESVEQVTDEDWLEEAPPEEEPQPAATPQEIPQRRGRGWLVALTVLLVTVVIVYGAYRWSMGLWPFTSQSARIERLRNQAQSYLVSQRYCRALEISAKLATAVPGDLEAINAIAKSKSKLYDEALAHIKANNVAKALENLQCILGFDASYKDVAQRIENLGFKQELGQAYGTAREDLNSRAYGEAISGFLRIRALDQTYKPGTISDDLYEAYMGQARQWLDLAEADLVPTGDVTEPGPQFVITEDLLTKMRQAIVSYKNALEERPSSEQADAERTRAEALYLALEQYRIERWAEAAEPLVMIYAQEPEYLAGKLSLLLCDTLLLLGDSYEARAEHQPAIDAYQEMLKIEGCSAAVAQTRVHQAGIHLTPTSTPTSTPRPTATYTPRPSPTPTAQPTATPVPPEPTSPPSQPHPTSKPQPTEAPPPRRTRPPG